MANQNQNQNRPGSQPNQNQSGGASKSTDFRKESSNQQSIKPSTSTPQADRDTEMDTE